MPKQISVYDRNELFYFSFSCISQWYVKRVWIVWFAHSGVRLFNYLGGLSESNWLQM